MTRTCLLPSRQDVLLGGYATRCLEGTVEASPRIAWCRSMGRPAALIGAGNGLASPEGWDCWLRLWLPELARFSGVRSSENSIRCATAGAQLAYWVGGVVPCKPQRIRSPRQAGSRHCLLPRAAARSAGGWSPLSF
jgi:hypothetical protein